MVNDRADFTNGQVFNVQSPEHGDMYTDAGRQLAARRIAVMEEFLRTFYAEWDGRDAEALGAVEPPDSLNALLEGSIEVGDGVRRRSTSILQSNPIN
jgi:hypothetical protein